MTILENDIRKKSGRFDDYAFSDIGEAVKALGKWVFIEIPPEEKSAGGLYLAKDKRQHLHVAKVLALSTEAEEYGLTQGDFVVIADFRMELLDGKRGFMHYEQVCGVVTDLEKLDISV